MYWYKDSKVIGCLALALTCITACRPNVHEPPGQKRYFDLLQFMHTDSARLSSVQRAVIKTVIHNNGAAQTKHINIKNWGQELHLFSASDINKPAWRNSYRIEKKGDSVVYTALQPELFTRRMAVYTTGKQVKKISINNKTSNMLYQTTEHLVYYPDSLYQIDKVQRVRIIGNNHYLITGKIK